MRQRIETFRASEICKACEYLYPEGLLTDVEADSVLRMMQSYWSTFPGTDAGD